MKKQLKLAAEGSDGARKSSTTDETLTPQAAFVVPQGGLESPAPPGPSTQTTTASRQQPREKVQVKRTIKQEPTDSMDEDGASKAKRPVDLSLLDIKQIVIPGRPGCARNEASLVLLTKRFMELLRTSCSHVINIKSITNDLNVKKRRIYDITNVLEGIQLIRKKSTNTFEWMATPFATKDTAKLDKLIEQERVLDEQIQSCMRTVYQMSQNKNTQRLTYLTHDDVLTMPSFKDQTVIVIKAPPETKLQVAHPEERFQVHIRSTRAPVDVFFCSDDPVSSVDTDAPAANESQPNVSDPVLPDSSLATVSQEDDTNNTPGINSICNTLSKTTVSTSDCPPPDDPVANESQPNVSTHGNDSDPTSPDSSLTPLSPEEMADLAKTCIRAAINEALPEISETYKGFLEETLLSIGVEADIDFRLVKQADLKPVLKPLQARHAVAVWRQRWLTPDTSSSSVCQSSGASASFQSVSATSSSSPCSNSHQRPQTDMVGAFSIPWGKLPEWLMKFLERGKRLSPIMRREVVGVVATEMLRHSPRFPMRNIIQVAKKMVAKYPKSLRDAAAGGDISLGYYSILKQLHHRFLDVKRYKTKRRQEPRKRRCRPTVKGIYGCVNWNVRSMPPGECPQSQQQKIEKLKMMSRATDANLEEMKLLMLQTYYSQRKQVNQRTSIKQILEEWPFWFQEPGMALHFKELTGVELMETFTLNMNMKGERLLDYLRSVGESENTKLLEDLTKIKATRGEQSGCSEDVKEMVLLLLSFFSEPEDAMLRHVEDTCLAGDVQMDQFPVTPTIVVCGQSCFSSRRFMLSVDRQIVQDRIPSFVSALCMMFGSYFCFSFCYPTQLASTLDFLQRYFFSIDPKKGSKVEKAYTTQHSVNTRVLTLIQDLSDPKCMNKE